jgi:serine O-acetyltransferase
MFDNRKIELLWSDIRQRAIKSGLRGIAAFHFFLREPQYRTLFWHRLAEAANNRFVRDGLRRLYLRSSRRSGLEILVPELGGGVIMPHWGRIILNAESIGNGLYVFHNVTVGNDYRTGRPVIGSNVFLGAGSILIGKIHIGDHVVVAAGSVVVQDVPSKSIVAGNPARVIKSLEPEETRSLIGY